MYILIAEIVFSHLLLFRFVIKKLIILSLTDFFNRLHAIQTLAHVFLSYFVKSSKRRYTKENQFSSLKRLIDGRASVKSRCSFDTCTKYRKNLCNQIYSMFQHVNGDCELFQYFRDIYKNGKYILQIFQQNVY